MSKEKDLAVNTAIITFGKICTQFFSFLMLPLYTSILSTSEYGTVDLILTCTSLFLPITTLAIEQALFRYLIDVRMEQEKEESIISTCIIFIAGQCLLLTVVLSTIQYFIRNDLMIFFIMDVVSCIASTTVLQLSRGLGDNIGYTLGSAFTAIFLTAFNVLFLLVFRMGTIGMLLATFLGNLAGTIIIICKNKLYLKLSVDKFDRKLLKEMVNYSIPLIPNQLSWWALNASDKIIVSIFIGVTGNGILAIAHKFPSIYIQFSSVFNLSWTESATLHIKEEDAKDFFTKTLRSVFGLFSCACFGIIVCIPFVFELLINVKYKDAYPLIPIFMLASLGNVVVSLYGVIYVAYKRTKEISQTAIYAVLINVISHLLLVKFIGIYASAISSLLGYGCMALYRYFHSRRYLDIRFETDMIVKILVMMAVSLISYYSQIIVLHVSAFVIIITISIIMNRDMFFAGIKMVKRMFLNCKKR